MATRVLSIATEKALFREIDRQSQEFLEAIDFTELSRFNAGYKRYATNPFKFFVQNEQARFSRALTEILRHRTDGSVCDIGCFVPYLPMALARLGYRVKIVDKYSLLGDVMYSAVSRIADRFDIEVCDIDILADDLGVLGRHDIVLLMAVVEHLNGSPRQLLESVRSIINRDGLLLFEVPNIAELGKRIRCMLGKSPLPTYSDYFLSDYPYMGHNREMTVEEVKYLLSGTGFSVRSLVSYDYSPWRVAPWKARLLRLIKAAIPLGDWEESIMATATVQRRT